MRTVRVLICTLAAGALAACGSGAAQPSTSAQTTHLSASRPEYTTLDEAGKASDALVVGSINTERAAVDDGGAGSGPQIPVRLAQFVVTRATPASLSGHTITVVLPGASSTTVTHDDLPTLETAKSYALFLDKLERTDRGGLQDEGVLYTVTGSASTMFAVDAGSARAMAPGLVAVRPGGQSLTNRQGTPLVALDTLMRTPVGA